MIQHFKDEILDQLAARANIAQFVSFDPALNQRFSRVFGYPPNHNFGSVRAALDALLEKASEGSINIRSFEPRNPKSRQFKYGIRTPAQAQAELVQLAGEGLYTIVNETIDVRDGGVSGVALGNVLEFAPGDTPRAVEKPGIASFPRQVGLRVLETVYGFAPALDYPNSTRVEFSVHPLRRGVRNEHTIIWELEEIGHTEITDRLSWPNEFSKFIGDKAFGLLVAHLLGLPVPRTTVIGRNVQPFSFGISTQTAETWIRTCPVVQMPGKFTTRRGWIDPYDLMVREDPNGDAIASVLAQEGVAATYSGAVISATPTNGDSPSLIIEGTSGFGDEFMVGLKAKVELPAGILDRVRSLYEHAASLIGPVRMEWVSDSDRIWVVQFHRGASVSYGHTIVPGNASKYHRFEAKLGLEALRNLVQELRSTDEGIALVGDVGITSHFGDVLRRAQIPSIIQQT